MTKREFMHTMTTATIKALKFIQDIYDNEQESPEYLQKQLDEKLAELEDFNNRPMSAEAASDPENLASVRSKKEKLYADIAQLSLRIKNEATNTPATLKQFGVQEDTNAFVFVFPNGIVYTIDTIKTEKDVPACAERILYETGEYIAKVISAYENTDCDNCDLIPDVHSFIAALKPFSFMGE